MAQPLKGDVVRLRNDALPNARVREWIFLRAEGKKVILAHKDGDYEWVAEIDQIDWDDFISREEKSSPTTRPVP